MVIVVVIVVVVVVMIVLFLVVVVVAWGTVVGKALRYKSVGHGIDSRR